MGSRFGTGRWHEWGVTQQACRHRSRTSPSEKDTLRLDMSPGANSGGRSFLPRALPVHLDPSQSCAATQNIALFLHPPDRCKIWSFLYHLTACCCVFCCPAQGLRGAGTAHVVEWKWRGWAHVHFTKDLDSAGLEARLDHRDARIWRSCQTRQVRHCSGCPLMLSKDLAAFRAQWVGNRVVRKDTCWKGGMLAVQRQLVFCWCKTVSSPHSGLLHPSSTSFYHLHDKL